MNRYSGVKPEYYIKELSEVIIRLSIHEHLKQVNGKTSRNTIPGTNEPYNNIT